MLKNVTGDYTNKKNCFRKPTRTSGITGIRSQLEECNITDSLCERTGSYLKSFSPSRLTVVEKLSQFKQADDTSMNNNSNYTHEMPQEYIQQDYPHNADQP